jgi:hypothetical protein
MIFQFFSTSSLLANYGILPPVVVPVNSAGRRRRGTNQLVRKSGRENKEMEGKGRRDGKDRGEGKRNTKPAPADEKEWKREQGDGRKRQGGEMEKIEENGG